MFTQVVFGDSLQFLLSESTRLKMKSLGGVPELCKHISLTCGLHVIMSAQAYRNIPLHVYLITWVTRTGRGRGGGSTQ